MRIFELRQQQLLPQNRDELFPFFSQARNLESITPPWLRFEVRTPEPIVMESGALIKYRLYWRGLPIAWTTEITVWEPPFRFVDRQLRGPYRLWEHEHRFEQHEDGTLMTDILRYAVFGGRLVQKLFVARDVERVFEFRKRRLEELFAAKDVSDSAS
jgi:ligand-binding SRPBCC domain-containing protein